MKLNEIRDNEGSHHRFKRLGRGSGSGKGKTSGKGVKGQKARTGHHGMFGFEGGQMPLHMRIPKRGFNNIFAREFAELNIGQLQKAVESGKIKAGANLNADTLATLGVARRARDGVRLLGKGELKTQLNLEVAHASGSAIEAVKKAGGTIKVVGVKAKHVTRKDRAPGKRAQRRVAAAKKREERAAAAQQAKQA
jgi:large subunit ribosomal protein L15